MSAPDRPSPPAASGRRADPAQPQPALPPFRPVNRRQQTRIAVLTLATVAGLTYVLQRPHQQLVADKAARQAAACQGPVASRPADCPGARMPVRVLPAVTVAPAASR